ncbi:mucin-13 [Phascolarctos cinereus]
MVLVSPRPPNSPRLYFNHSKNANSLGGPEYARAKRDSSHAGPERGGAQRHSSHGGPERGGAQRDSSHAGPERGGAQRDSSHAGPERGGAQRDSSHGGPSTLEPSGTAATRPERGRRPAGRSHAGPERGGAQRDGSHAGPERGGAQRQQQDPSAGAPSGQQPRRTRARRRPAGRSHAGPERGGAQRDGHAGPERGGAQRDGSHGGPERGGAQRDGSHAGPERGGAQRDRQPRRTRARRRPAGQQPRRTRAGGAQRDSSHAGPERGGAQRDAATQDPSAAAPSGQQPRRTRARRRPAGRSHAGPERGGAQRTAATQDPGAAAPSGTAATQDPSAAAPSGTAATEDPSAAAPSGTAATQDPSAAAPSGTAATQDPSAAAPSGTAATQDPSAAAPSGTAATQDPSARRPAGQQPRRTRARRRPAGQQPRRTRARRRPAGRSHAGPERGGAQRTHAGPSAAAPSGTQPRRTRARRRQRDAATQDPSAAAPSGTQPRRTRARRRPAAAATQDPDLITQPMQATSQTPSASVPDELCTEKICYGSSECIELNTTSFCLCPEGYYYKDSQCNQGRTFPGMVTILEYLSDLDNKNSPNYQSLHFKIEKLFASAFADNTTYGQTVILNVQPSAVTRSEMRSSTGEVDVWVVNIFDKNSDMTLDDVSKTIETQIGNDIISYRAENPCDFNGCKNDGEDCSNGFTCNCLQGLARPTGSSSCTDCSSDCSEINNKQCIKKTNSRIPECQCLPGYISEDETCRECDFGYSGVDCKDNYILIFTVVCTIGGAILLGTIIGLIVLARSNKRKKRTEEDSLISSEFSNMRLETTGFSNPAFSNGSLFPKVNARLPRVQSHPYEDPYPQRSMPARDY